MDVPHQRVNVTEDSAEMDSDVPVYRDQIRAKSETLAVETQNAETEMEERHACATTDQLMRERDAQANQSLATVQAILIVRHSTNGDST